MRLQPIAIPTAVLVSLCTAALYADDAVTLRYKMAKGDQIYYRSRVEKEFRATIEGKAFTGQQSREWVWSLRVDSINEKGDYHVTVLNHRLKAHHRSGVGQEYSFDSRSSERDRTSGQGAVFTPIFERLSGQVFEAVITPRGEVNEVKGCADYWRDLVQGQYFATVIVLGAGNDEIAKVGLQKQLPALSQLALIPGDTWEVPYEIEWPKLDKWSGKSQGKTMYRLVGPDKIGQQATVKCEVSLEGTETRDYGEGSVQAGSITNSSGTIQFDPAAGRVVSNQVTYTMPMTSTKTQNPFQWTVKETLELLDKLPD